MVRLLAVGLARFETHEIHDRGRLMRTQRMRGIVPHLTPALERRIAVTEAADGRSQIRIRRAGPNPWRVLEGSRQFGDVILGMSRRRAPIPSVPEPGR
jgi:hypothetical protein